MQKTFISIIVLPINVNFINNHRVEFCNQLTYYAGISPIILLTDRFITSPIKLS